MYNRYIRNDRGDYTRIPQEEPGKAHEQRSSQAEAAPHRETPRGEERARESSDRCEEEQQSGAAGFVRHLLDRFHLESVDTGDLLLLVLLFFLFEEDADEELLIALGLLLIL